MTPFRWTLSFLRPYKNRVVAIAALATLEIGLAALAPWPLKTVVDNVLGGRPVARRAAHGLRDCSSVTAGSAGSL